MSDTVKKLVLQLLVDTKQADKLTQVMKAWDTKAKGLSKTFGSLGLGDMTKGGGKDNLTKTLTETTAQLAKFGLASQKTGKILEEGFGRAVEKDRQKLEDYKKSLADTEARIQRFDRVIESMKRRGASAGAIGEASGRRDDLFSRFMGQGGEAAGLADKLGMGAGGGGGGFMNSIMSQGLGAVASKILPVAIPAMIMKMITDIPAALDRNNLRPSELAGRAGWYQGMNMQPGNRDYSALLAQSLANPELLGSVADPNSGRRYEQQLTRGFQALLPFSGVPITDAGLLGYDEEAGRQFRSAEAGDQVKQFFENMKQKEPMKFAAINRFSSAAGQTAGFQRQMGMGDDPTRDYLNSVYGSTGHNFNAEEIMTGGSAIEAAGGGRGNAGLTSAALNAQLLGVSGAPGIAGRLAAGGGAHSALAKLTGLTPAAANAAGEYLASNYLGAGNGLNSGAGLADYLTGGVGSMDSSQQMREVGLRSSGLAGLGAALGGAGSDSYTRALGMANAININPSGSFFANDSMASLSPQDALQIIKSGEVPTALKAQGITLPMLKKQVSATFGENLAARVAGLDNGASDNVSKMARAVSAKGADVLGMMTGDVSTAGLGLDAAQGSDEDALGVLLAKAGLAGSADEGKALVHGLRAKAGGAGKDPGGTAAGVEQKAKEQEFKQFMEGQELIKNLPKDLKGFSDQIKKAAEEVEIFNQKLGEGILYMGAGIGMPN